MEAVYAFVKSKPIEYEWSTLLAFGRLQRLVEFIRILLGRDLSRYRQCETHLGLVQ